MFGDQTLAPGFVFALKLNGSYKLFGYYWIHDQCLSGLVGCGLLSGRMGASGHRCDPRFNAFVKICSVSQLGNATSAKWSPSPQGAVVSTAG